MTFDNPLATLWRRRLLFIVTLVGCMAAVAAVTLALPRVYRATATVFVDHVGTDVSPDQLVHTYSALAANPNVAAQVRSSLPYSTTTDELLKDVSFTPIETSQLFEITAESSSARRAQTTANVYAGFFVRHVAAQISQGGLRQRASLAETASRPDDASRPNLTLSLGLGFLLSLFAAVAAVILRELLDRRVRVSGEDRSLMDVPILGRIPRDRKGVGARLDDAYRMLRVNLELQGERTTKVIAVTSPSAEEGKSTVVAKLALATAADGLSVVVIEGDLRRPGLSRELAAMGLTPGAGGLTAYLEGTAEAPGIVTDARSGVAAVFAGTASTNPTRLLRSARMTGLIHHLAGRFDQVIIDTPPVPVGADASLLAKVAGSVLVVVDARRTRTPELAGALEQLRAIDAEVLGIALNNADVVRSVADYYRAGPGDAAVAQAPSGDGGAQV